MSKEGAARGSSPCLRPRSKPVSARLVQPFAAPKERRRQKAGGRIGAIIDRAMTRALCTGAMTDVEVTGAPNPAIFKAG